MKEAWDKHRRLFAVKMLVEEAAMDVVGVSQLVYSDAMILKAC